MPYIGTSLSTNFASKGKSKLTKLKILFAKYFVEKNNPINPISKLHIEIKFGLIFKNMGEIKIANNL